MTIMCRKLQTTPKRNITCNLIFILVKELQQSNMNSTQVRLTITNSQSLKNKDLLLYDHINTFNTNITVIMETWMKNNANDIAWSNKSLLNINNLKTLYFQKERQIWCWVLAANKAIMLQKEDDSRLLYFEYAKLRVDLSKGTTHHYSEYLQTNLLKQPCHISYLPR